MDQFRTPCPSYANPPRFHITPEHNWMHSEVGNAEFYRELAIFYQQHGMPFPFAHLLPGTAHRSDAARRFDGDPEEVN